MARLTDEQREHIIADFHIGKSQNELAKKYEVSPATINKLCKGLKPKHLPNNRASRSCDDPDCVYIVTADEFGPVYKIGLSNNVTSRIDAMQTGCPYHLYALRAYKVENPVAVEAMLHAFFHKKRVRGEWFLLDDTDLAYIDDAMDCVDEVINGEH